MRNLQKQRGATLIDILVIVGCIVLVGVLLSRIPDLIDYTQRKSCYKNQELLESALYSILEQEKKEISQVAMAYVVRSNVTDQPSKIVVLFTAPSGKYWDSLHVSDLPLHFLPRNASCPNHSEAKKTSRVIDYAFLWGKWRCMHKVSHN